jgi:phosphohistidine phosphatase
MDLLIVRHAIAMERDAKRWPDDRLLPLSARGIARGRKAAIGLGHLTARPALVLASPLLRARHTAQILERYARWPRAQPCAELVPEAMPPDLLGRLARSDGSCIAVVGHEPHLGALLAQCLPGGTERGIVLRKMGVALIQFGERVRPGRGRLVWLATPRILRAARKARSV